MMAAIGTSAVGYRLVMRRKQPILADRFSLPVKQTLDTPLILGSAVFGVGFGLSGYCAGPVVASLATGALPAIVFTAGMLAGFVAYGWFEKATARSATTSAAGSRP